jgi:hypothetical protein
VFIIRDWVQPIAFAVMRVLPCAEPEARVTVFPLESVFENGGDKLTVIGLFEVKSTVTPATFMFEILTLAVSRSPTPEREIEHPGGGISDEIGAEKVPP